VSDAVLGRSYAFNSSWYPSPIPVVTPREIGILHDFPGAARSFGVSQVIDTGSLLPVLRRSPIGAFTIPFTGGYGILQPTSTITLYFTLKPGDGLVLAEGPSIPESKITLTLAPDVPTYVRYIKGQWSADFAKPASIPQALAGPPTWDERFYFTLAGEVNVFDFTQWLQKTVKHIAARPVSAAIESALILEEVISDKDRSKEILDLKGKWYESPLVTTVVQPGVEVVEGRRVKILDVAPVRTPFDELLKLLPGRASRS